MCDLNNANAKHQHSVRTIAFPALGTGVGRFPVEQAAMIAATEIQKFLNTHFSVDQVSIVCTDEQSYREYKRAVEDSIGSTTKLIEPSTI